MIGISAAYPEDQKRNVVVYAIGDGTRALFLNRYNQTSYSKMIE
jgi:hypothetical protein